MKTRQLPVRRPQCHSAFEGPTRMSRSPLPLSYCTNVHPGNTLEEVYAGLDGHAAQVQKLRGGTLGAGLWLSRSVMNGLADADERKRLRDRLAARDMTCYTLNAF